MPTKRRPWPNWAKGVLDRSIMGIESALTEYDTMITHLERGDAQVAGIALARMARELSRVQVELQTARNAKGEAQ